MFNRDVDVVRMGQTGMLERLSYWILLGLVVWAPLPLGSNRPWSWFLLALLVAVALTLLSLDRHKSGNTWSVRAWWLGALFLVFMVMQIAPMPMGALAYISPSAATLVFSDPGTKSGWWHPLSVDPYSTKSRLVVQFSYLGAFILSVALVRGPRRLKAFVIMLVASASFNSLYGLINYLDAGLLGYFRPAAFWGDGVTGTYVNKNHFSGLMEMAFPAAFGMLVISLRGRGQQPSNAMRLLISWQEIIAVFLIGCGLALSGSRSGALIFLALVFIYIFSFVELKNKRYSIFVVTVLVAFSASMIVFLWHGGLGRLLSSDISGSRLLVWRDTLKVISDYWLVGSGGGTYRWLFPEYKSSALDPLLYDHAHNGYLEMLVEYGVIGSALKAFFVLDSILRGVRRIKHSTSDDEKCLRLALLLGVLSMLVHELVDFNMSIPANGFIFFSILGVLCARNHVRGK